MRLKKFISGFLLVFPFALYAAYDSALSPYPWRKDNFSPEVEALLGAIEANSPSDGAFQAEVTWRVDPGSALDWRRNRFGPLSGKSSLNWHHPGKEGFWKEGKIRISGREGNFRIEKEADPSSPADWWEKQGEHIYSRGFCDDWPFVWRLHHDSLEADSLAYCEGLGLLLWAFQSGEYLRRADFLEVGQDVPVNGKTYRTLVATPEWIKKTLFLENRTNYPFNESTLISWASLRPVITYFIDPDLNIIAGASFQYYRVLRSSPKDWKAIAKPRDLRIDCFATEIQRSPRGTWYPVQIVGEVYGKEGKLLRRLTFEVRLLDPPTSWVPRSIPQNKRQADPWPPYRIEVFKQFLQKGDQSHAVRFGLARSLAYEGFLPEAFAAIDEAPRALEADSKLLAQTWGGVDWELGFALYELLWRYDLKEVQSFFDAIPRTQSWFIVVRKALDLYSRYRPKEVEKLAQLWENYNLYFEQVKAPASRLRNLLRYRFELKKRALAASSEQRRRILEKYAKEIDALIEAR